MATNGRPRGTMILKLAGGAFLVALLTIVVLADRGELDQYISFYRKIPFGDAIGHFVLMGTLSFIANCFLKVKTVGVFGRRVLLGSLIVFSFVLFEECSQLFFPARTFSLVDLAADVAGICLFGWFAQLAYRWKQGAGKPNNCG